MFSISKLFNSLGSGGFFRASTGYTPPTRGTKELLEMYSQSPWLRAVVSKVGRGVAETEWRLFVQKGGSGKAVKNSRIARSAYDLRDKSIKAMVDADTMKEIDDHPLLDFLHNGNEHLIGHGCIQTTQSHIDLVGEAYWLLERDGLNMPIAYWPLPPDWIHKLPTKKDPWFVVSAPGGKQMRIPVTEMIVIKDPDPSNPYGRGSGIAQSLGDELEIDEYSAKHMKAFFFNRARPDLIIHGDNMSKDDAERLSHQWKRDQGGFWNAFKPVFFSRKIEVKELSQTMENIQMIQIRKQERDTFINVYGVPPEKLGVVQDSKRSTIAAADFFWAKDIIKPRMEMLRLFLQAQLVPMFDERLILHYNTPVIQDDEFELKVMEGATWAFTINDWRKRANHPSLGPDGDVLVVPLNNEMHSVKSVKGGGKSLAPPENVHLPLPEVQERVIAHIKDAKKAG